MSSANSFRRVLAMPLVGCDTVRKFMQNNPKTGNYAMMMSSFVVILTMGNGADKLTTRANLANSYESFRRANRGYVPYMLADYSYRFP